MWGEIKVCNTDHMCSQDWLIVGCPVIIWGSRVHFGHSFNICLTIVCARMLWGATAWQHDQAGCSASGSSKLPGGEICRHVGNIQSNHLVCAFICNVECHSSWVSCYTRYIQPWRMCERWHMHSAVAVCVWSWHLLLHWQLCSV